MRRTEHRQLDGQVVAITGGARGIGEATAQALRASRARVVIGDVDEEAGKATADRLGLEAFVPLDVTDPDSFAEFLRQTEATAGPLDVLVNNAGIMPVGPLLDEDETTAQRVININVHGVITGTKLAVRMMRERGSGHVVNVASMAGVVSVPGLATYNASKFAVVGFTDAVRLEVRPLGIDVSTILPYFVNTELAAGTNGPPGLKKAEPVQVAQAIVATLERPVPRVYVPRAAGNLVRVFRKLPQAWTERLNRAIGGDDIFLDGVDHHARAAYESRARGPESSDAPSDHA